MISRFCGAISEYANDTRDRYRRKEPVDAQLNEALCAQLSLARENTKFFEGG